MRILLLTENPVLALGLEAALFQAQHTSLLLCSTVAQLRAQLAARQSSLLDPPDVLVLDHAHVGMAVLNELKEEMKAGPHGALLGSCRCVRRIGTTAMLRSERFSC